MTGPRLGEHRGSRRDRLTSISASATSSSTRRPPAARTGLLIFYFVAAVVLIILLVYLVVAAVLSLAGTEGRARRCIAVVALWDPGLFAMVALGTLALIGGGSLYRSPRWPAAGTPWPS